MSRWQPPHPAKEIRNQPPRTTQPLPSTANLKWGMTCCWPRCRQLGRPIGDVPLCGDHVETVVKAKRKYDREFADALQDRITSLARKDDDRAREKAIAAGRMPSDAVPREGVVYYLLVGVHIKIGFSLDLSRRIRAYPPDTKVLGLEIGTRGLEKQRHQQFEAYRAMGREWFTDHAEIRAHIATNCLRWSPEHKVANGPAGPRRAHIKLKYRNTTSGWRVA